MVRSWECGRFQEVPLETHHKTSAYVPEFCNSKWRWVINKVKKPFLPVSQWCVCVQYQIKNTWFRASPNKTIISKSIKFEKRGKKSCTVLFSYDQTYSTSFSSNFFLTLSEQPPICIPNLSVKWSVRTIFQQISIPYVRAKFILYTKLVNKMVH